MMGFGMDTQEWLEKVRKALLEEGFEFTAFQDIKEGQSFGVVKDIDDSKQMHVRGFEDGHLEAEIEVSRYFLEHPETSKPATEELREILDSHDIEYDEEPQLKSPVEKSIDVPSTLTDWRSQIHPNRYKAIGIISIIIGVLANVLSLYLWNSPINGINIPKESIPLFLVIVGIFLISVGIGIIYFSNLVGKAMKGELEPPKSEKN